MKRMSDATTHTYGEALRQAGLDVPDHWTCRGCGNQVSKEVEYEWLPHYGGHSAFCSGCADAQKARHAEQERLRAQKEAEARERRINRAVVEFMGDDAVCEEFRAARLDNYHPQTDTQRRAFEAAQMIAAVGGSGFWHGAVGTGKTHLVVGTGRARIEAEAVQEALYLYEPLFSRQYCSLFGQYGEADRLFERYVNVELLVIDDMASGKMSDQRLDLLMHLLHVRLGSGRDTLATSNHTLDEIAQLTDDRLVSRFIAMCGGIDSPRIVQNIVGPDWRLRRAQ